MKRAVHYPAVLALSVVALGTCATLWWLWQRSLPAPGEIRCNNGGHSVFACDTDFGNYATFIALFALPLIAWLAHKAFFTRFRPYK